MGLLLWFMIFLAMLWLDRCIVMQRGGNRRKRRKRKLSLARR